MGNLYACKTVRSKPSKCPLWLIEVPGQSLSELNIYLALLHYFPKQKQVSMIVLQQVCLSLLQAPVQHIKYCLLYIKVRDSLANLKRTPKTTEMGPHKTLVWLIFCFQCPGHYYSVSDQNTILITTFVRLWFRKYVTMSWAGKPARVASKSQEFLSMCIQFRAYKCEMKCLSVTVCWYSTTHDKKGYYIKASPCTNSALSPALSPVMREVEINWCTSSFYWVW